MDVVGHLSLIMVGSEALGWGLMIWVVDTRPSRAIGHVYLPKLHIPSRSWLSPSLWSHAVYSGVNIKY